MIIDSHTKIYPPHFNNIREALLKTDATFSSLFSNPNAHLVSGSDLLTSMNRNKIDMSIIAGIGWTNLEVAKQANNYLLEDFRIFQLPKAPKVTPNQVYGTITIAITI